MVGDTYEHLLRHPRFNWSILQGVVGLSIVGKNKNQRNMVYSCSADPICLFHNAGVDYLDYINLGYSKH